MESKRNSPTCLKREVWRSINNNSWYPARHPNLNKVQYNIWNKDYIKLIESKYLLTIHYNKKTPIQMNIEKLEGVKTTPQHFFKKGEILRK